MVTGFPPARGEEGSTTEGIVATLGGALEHAAQVDDLLLVDVVMTRGVEELGFRPEGDLVAAVVLLGHGRHTLEKGEDVVPLNVVAHRMTEDLLHRGLMVPI